MSSVPAPPGTQITSSCGQAAKVVVGVSVSTESLGTGSIRFQIRCTLAPGTLENTCSGPVKSSWVTLGKITRPIWSGADILKAFRGLRFCGQHLRPSLPGKSAKRVFALDDPAIHHLRDESCEDDGCPGQAR